MLPDFVVAKKRFRHDLNKFLRAEVHKRGVARLVTNKRIFEGDRMEASVRDTDGERDETTFNTFEYAETVDTAKLIEDGLSFAVENVSSFVDKIAADRDRFILEDIAKVCQQQNPDGDRLTFEAFLKVVETFPLKFDAQGKPRLQLVIPPIPSIQEEIESWNKNPECWQRYTQVLQTKYEQWQNEEAKRRLVE